MLGNTLVTIQAGPVGKLVNRLYITNGVDIDKEFYLALLVDRASGRIAMVARFRGRCWSEVTTEVRAHGYQTVPR